ncbi:hypothetical protein BJ138DRAFT_1006122 [Hygrophoropsis aurantiaca]|uniref:Uncharacterized protein n=1 Tax=Hygrophoropsis aurantiaca TaxID=72124 RepID=A0ACB8AEC3_9AGAM|nr:hypothetical protein BJ138DRAFT_1006122 [Hygrophoropsis aurantiaca]
MTPEDTPTDEGDLPETSASRPLKPGTFVDIRKSGISTTGIVLSGAFYEKRAWILSLTPDGEIVQHVDADVYLEVPGVVPFTLATRAGQTELPQNQNEVMARVEILKRLRQIDNTIVKAYNIIGQNNMDLHNLVKAKNPDEWATISLPAAADLISDYEGGSYTTLLAVHKYMMNRPEEFVPDIVSHRFSQTFEVRPQSHLDKLQVVRALVRQKSPELQSFIEKARRIVQSNRTRAVKTWDGPLVMTEVDDISYTAQDRVIIDVLCHALRRSREIQTDPYSGVVAHIIKHLSDFYTFDEADQRMLREVLVDIGELSPWDDLIARRGELNLDQRLDADSPTIVAQNKIIERNLALDARTLNPSAPLGEEDFYIRDPVEHLRHDFGDLPVYVVDDVGAEELDDGLSVESIPSEPGSAWVHVHIADPTSIIPPTHVFAHQARQMGFTSYFIQRTWPMLPTSLTHQRLSLGAASRSGQPEPVLTFSFKIDADGNIADWTVRAGLVKNIVTISYDAVDSILGYSKVVGSFPFGKPPQASTPSISTQNDESRTNSLRLLDDIARRYRLRSQQLSNNFNYEIPKADISVQPKPLPQPPSHSLKPTQFEGFPHVTYEVKTQSHDEYGSRMMIADFMKCACRVASRWLTAQGVPMLRRVSQAPIAWSNNALEDLLSTRDERGYVDYFTALKAEIYMPPVDYTLEPGMHWSLGVPDGEGYIQVTSPLRRYGDLLAHWQIKSALLNSASSQAAFSAEWLKSYGKEALSKGRVLKRAYEAHTRHWAYMYIDRWMKHPQPAPDRVDPLGSITARLTSGVKVNRIARDYHWNCLLPGLGVKAIYAQPRQAEYEVGQELHNLKISAVRLGHKPMIYVSQR